MKQFVLLFLLAMGFLTLHAQISISKATIVKESKEVIEVYIRNAAYEGTPQKFEFSLTKEGPYSNINVAEIRSIRFSEGDLYEKKFISVAAIVATYINRQLFDYSDPEKMHTGPTLVAKLIDGPVSLFEYVDKYSYSHFFYSTSSEDEIIYLPNRLYQSEDGIFIKDQPYKSMIAALIAQKQCANLSSIHPAKLNYSSRDIIKAFREINDCAGGIKNDIVRIKPKQKLAFGILGGVFLTKLNYFPQDAERFPGVSAKSFGRSLNPAFGIYLELYPAKKLRNYSGSIELVHQSYHYTTDSIFSGYNRAVANIKTSILNVNPMIKLLWGKNKINGFVEGGVSLYYVYKSSLDYESLHTIYYDIRKASTNENGDFGILGLIGIGVDFKLFSIQARYGFIDYQHLGLLVKCNIFR